MKPLLLPLLLLISIAYAKAQDAPRKPLVLKTSDLTQSLGLVSQLTHIKYGAENYL